MQSQFLQGQSISRRGFLGLAAARPWLSRAWGLRVVVATALQAARRAAPPLPLRASPAT